MQGVRIGAGRCGSEEPSFFFSALRRIRSPRKSGRVEKEKSLLGSLRFAEAAIIPTLLQSRKEKARFGFDESSDIGRELRRAATSISFFKYADDLVKIVKLMNCLFLLLFKRMIICPHCCCNIGVSKQLRHYLYVLAV